MKKKNTPFYEAALLLLGEIIVSAIVCAVYLIIGKFSYKVVTGVCLGSAVIVLNYLFLAISTSRAFENARKLRGTREMTEEEIAEFTEKHQAEVNNAIKLSYIIRTFTMLATLVVAFILDWFDVIATVVPLLMFRPILIIESLIGSKTNKEEQ